MTTPATATRPDAAAPTTELIADLRRSLVEDLAAQQEHVAALRRAADSLMGQHDSDSLLERELAETSAVQALEVIADIEDALARIDAGTYGLCGGCGQPIAAARLEAIPHTRHCISCPPPVPRRIA